MIDQPSLVVGNVILKLFEGNTLTNKGKSFIKSNNFFDKILLNSISFPQAFMIKYAALME
ncbi:hypothetical protein OKW21_006088 [Catalinimonas alkaloidigena]|nr:hypothetical protein [Catalinimonas alkaloidigena]